VRRQVFRWKAIGPLLLLFVILGFLVWLFAEPVARDTTEEASSELLGTEVDVAKLDLLPRQASVELRGLQIADPFVLTRNLLDAEHILLKLNPSALAEKKIVIENLKLEGMRFGTRRSKPARPSSGNGFAPQAYRAVEQWVDQFNVPLLSLTPIDTIRQIALNPGQLTTVREAQAMLGRTDSTRKELERNFQQLNIQPTLDSARALARQLAATDPKTLGVQGTHQALESVQQMLRSVAAAKQRVETLGHQTDAGMELLTRGVRSVDQARQRDYAFARSLLRLPTFSAPEIGTAFFGKVSIDRFKQALYWAELAQKYMPPGLLPRPTPGPKRLRAAGSTIEFPKLKEFPSFLLEQGRLDFHIGGSSPLTGSYAASVQGLTSAPALYGHPAVITAGRQAAGNSLGSIHVKAVIDHLSARTLDSATAELRGIELPTFSIPGVPFRVTPGVGSSDLAFSLRGDQLFGRWAIRSNQVRWGADSTAHSLNDLERVVWRVLSGLNTLAVSAELRGTVRSPQLSVSSNLDQAISQRLKAVIGEEVAKAEQRVRAKVDSLIGEKLDQLQRQVASVQLEANARVAGEKQQVAQAQDQLNAQLKRLTGGLAPEMKLPKVKL
jgi:uncharacterized protein (TIGR03545 family)